MSSFLKIIFLLFFGLFFGQTANASSINKSEENRKNVVVFFNEAFNQKNFEAASKYLGPHYIQHNPNVADGVEGLRDYIQKMREKFPLEKVEIIRSFGEGNYVILHVHSILEPNTRGLAIMDIFRLENGKIVEHWSVSQNVPEQAANSNGMF